MKAPPPLRISAGSRLRQAPPLLPSDGGRPKLLFLLNERRGGGLTSRGLLLPSAGGRPILLVLLNEPRRELASPRLLLALLFSPSDTGGLPRLLTLLSELLRRPTSPTGLLFPSNGGLPRLLALLNEPRSGLTTSPRTIVALLSQEIHSGLTSRPSSSPSKSMSLPPPPTLPPTLLPPSPP